MKKPVCFSITRFLINLAIGAMLASLGFFFVFGCYTISYAKCLYTPNVEAALRLNTFVIEQWGFTPVVCASTPMPMPWLSMELYGAGWLMIVVSCACFIGMVAWVFGTRCVRMSPKKTKVEKLFAV